MLQSCKLGRAVRAELQEKILVESGPKCGPHWW